MKKRGGVNRVTRQGRDRASARPPADLVTGGREVDMAAADKGRPIGRARRVPELKPGKYSDGLPLDEVQ